MCATSALKRRHTNNIDDTHQHSSNAEGGRIEDRKVTSKKGQVSGVMNLTRNIGSTGEE